MSDIFASPAAASTRPVAGQGAAETAVRVVDPSPDLSRLASGESLRGTVVGRDDHGHLQVRTRLGVLTLTLPKALPVGTEVVLQVRSVGPQVILNLLPLATPAPGAAPLPTAPGAAPPPGGPAVPHAPPPAPSDIVDRGHLLRAVLHAAPPLPSLAGLPTAQPGTELLVRILSLGLHAPLPGGAATLPAGVPAAAAAPVVPGSPPAAPGLPGAAGAAPAGAGSVPAAATPATVAGGGAAPPGAPTPVPAGLAGSPATPSLQIAPDPSPGLRLAPQAPVGASGHSLAAALQGAGSLAAAKAAGVPAVTMAGGGVPSPATPPAPGTAAPPTGTVKVTALVTAATSSGQPILHTPLGTLTLDTRAGLPLGTSLALEVALPAAGPPAALGLGAHWPSQESLEQALFQGLTAGQAEALARTLPQVGPRLASSVLFFLSALNQGNLADWLGRAGGGQAERAELPAGLAERLGREIAGLARSIETPSGDWRFVNLPLWSDQGLRELRCYFRHQQHGGKGGGEGDKATRFVLELELRRHGALQLDGLVRGRLFDLVLRSRLALPAQVRGDLMALFEEANAIAGYSGRLVFQASQDWLQLAAARSAAQPHDGLKV
ncbi:MAG: hypothetical protein ACM35H_06730 [Bacteroidota bacterium]|nr:hypothetical protein [Kiloniellaceae bacterium]